MDLAGIEAELQYRRQLWEGLVVQGGPTAVPRALLRHLGIYGGAQGIWVDKARTSRLTEAGTGVTVSVLHTGRHYPDDVTTSDIIYHYPETNRAGSRDQGEVDSTKAARKLGLPVFVITPSSERYSDRDVHWGWVEDWDDKQRLFLISFGDEPSAPPLPESHEERPFEPYERSQRSTAAMVPTRPGQARFRFKVMQRYGGSCALCGVSLPELLDAAHLVGKRYSGSDDPRNGLAICSNHHRALDSGLVAIEPGSTRLRFRPSGPDRRELGIVVESLEHLPATPHERALQLLWERTTESWG